MKKIIPTKIVYALTFILSLLMSGEILYGQTDPLECARIAASNRDYSKAAECYEQALQKKSKDEKILEEAGDVYMALERYDKAENVFRRAFDESSRDGQVNRKLGTALSLLGKHPEAIEKLWRAMKYEDESLDARLALAEGYLRSDSLNKAELAIIDATKEFPDAPLAKVALGDLYAERNIFELAQNYYNEALELDGALVEPRLHLGQTYREMARRADSYEEANELYNKALGEFREVTQQDPKNAPAWRDMGYILILANRHEQAGQAFQKYVELRPDDPNGDILLAKAAYEGQFYYLVIPPAQRIIASSDPISQAFVPHANQMLARGFYATAKKFEKDGNSDSAAIYYGKSNTTYGNVPDSLLESNDVIWHGSAAMESGDVEGGVAVWKRVTSVFPDSCDLSFTIARRLYKMKRYDDVIQMLNTRRDICPSSPQSLPYFFIGLSHFISERNAEAIDAFGKSVAEDSSNVDSYYWMLNALAKDKRNDEINTVFAAMQRQGFEETEPEKVATGYYFRGVAMFQAKEYDAAVADFEKATELQPDYAQAYLYTALCYHFQKKKAQACENYRKTLQYDPENKTAKSNLGKLGC